MRLPRVSLLLAALLLLPVCTGLLRADTIYLKNGDKVDGKITAETPEAITVDYQVSAGISDTRTIPRAEIDRIEKPQPDLVAFAQLLQDQPGNNSRMTADAYDVSIKRLQDFLTQFPNSARAADAKKLVEAFTEEQKRVAGGELKFAGQWYTKEQAEKEQYQLRGQALFGQMQELATRDITAALNAFDQLEKNFIGSLAYPDAVEYAKKLVPALKQRAEKAQDTWKTEKAARDEATKRASNMQALLAEQKAEQDRLTAAYDAASKLKWPPFQPHNEKSLAKLIQVAGSEITRLEAIPLPKIRQSVEAAKKAQAAWAQKDLAATKAAAQEAKTLWDKNEVATRLQKEVQDAETAAKATPTPAPTTATPTPAPATAAAKTTPAPKKATPAESPAALPPEATPTPEDTTPFYMRLPFALGAVVVILVGLGVAKVMGRRRASAENADESGPVD